MKESSRGFQARKWRVLDRFVRNGAVVVPRRSGNWLGAVAVVDGVEASEVLFLIDPKDGEPLRMRIELPGVPPVDPNDVLAALEHMARCWSEVLATPVLAWGADDEAGQPVLEPKWGALAPPTRELLEAFSALQPPPLRGRGRPLDCGRYFRFLGVEEVMRGGVGIIYGLLPILRGDGVPPGALDRALDHALLGHPDLQGDLAGMQRRDLKRWREVADECVAQWITAFDAQGPTRAQGGEDTV